MQRSVSAIFYSFVVLSKCFSEDLVPTIRGLALISGNNPKNYKRLEWTI